MQIIESPQAFKKLYSHCAATIGKYDGMHLGHQKILSRLVEQAKAHSLPAVVILSEPQPEEFFSPQSAPARLNSFEEKVAFLEGFGIDIVFKMNFDISLSQMEASAFVEDILCSGLGLQYLIVGDDFKFGKNRAGDINLLRNLGKQFQFTCDSVGAINQVFENNSRRVSSTLVRALLKDGECQQAYELLGRYYSMSGEVSEGRKLGRQLGTPTANIRLAREELPLQGVFAVQIDCGEKLLNGIANIGVKPTIEGDHQPILEVHIFDFDDDIYGEKIAVSFLHKVREEQKFDSLESLQAQIQKDIIYTKSWFEQYAGTEKSVSAKGKDF